MGSNPQISTDFPKVRFVGPLRMTQLAPWKLHVLSLAPSLASLHRLTYLPISLCLATSPLLVHLTISTEGTLVRQHVLCGARVGDH